MQNYSVRKNINGSRRQNRSTEKERQTIDGAQTRNCEEVRRTRRSDKKIERRARTKDGQCVQVTDDYLYTSTAVRSRKEEAITFKLLLVSRILISTFPTLR